MRLFVVRSPSREQVCRRCGRARVSRPLYYKDREAMLEEMHAKECMELEDPITHLSAGEKAEQRF